MLHLQVLKHTVFDIILLQQTGRTSANLLIKQCSVFLSYTVYTLTSLGVVKSQRKRVISTNNAMSHSSYLKKNLIVRKGRKGLKKRWYLYFFSLLCNGAKGQLGTIH